MKSVPEKGWRYNDFGHHGSDRETCMTDFKLIRDVLDKPLCRPEEGDYACLADENDEQGMVNLCRRDGTVIMQLPRALWDQLVEKTQ